MRCVRTETITRLCCTALPFADSILIDRCDLFFNIYIWSFSYGSVTKHSNRREKIGTPSPASNSVLQWLYWCTVWLTLRTVTLSVWCQIPTLFSIRTWTDGGHFQVNGWRGESMSMFLVIDVIRCMAHSRVCKIILKICHLVITRVQYNTSEVLRRV